MSLALHGLAPALMRNLRAVLVGLEPCNNRQAHVEARLCIHGGWSCRGNIDCRADRDLSQSRTLVRRARKTRVQSTQLGVRTGMDGPLRADGVFGLADFAAASGN